MKYEYNIIILGAGSGGLSVAAGCASLGARVLLIEANKMGGDCLNSGCVPSKALLRPAHLLSELRNSSQLGLNQTVDTADIALIMARVRDVITKIAPKDSKERFQALGVDVINGFGKVVSPHSVMVNNKTYTGKAIVIATGSKPYIPNIDGLEEIDYLTNETIFKLKASPRSLTILGAGPIGLELGQAFAQLGCKVTILDHDNIILKKDEPEARELLLKALTDDNVRLILKSSISKVYQENDTIMVSYEANGECSSYKSDALLVATGRTPNTIGIGLKALGIKMDYRNRIITNKRMQTNIKSIYACGDAVGIYQFTHTANAEAEIIIKNALLHLPSNINYNKVSWCTYTLPEIAHVGKLEAELKNNTYKKIFLPLTRNDRAICDNHEGFVKILTTNKGIIIGATIAGEKAGDLIAVLNFALAHKMKITKLTSPIFSYPTEVEILREAAYAYIKENVKPWQKRLLNKIIGGNK